MSSLATAAGSGVNWTAGIVLFLLFALVTVMGFWATRWRRPTSMESLDEWGLGGRSQSQGCSNQSTGGAAPPVRTPAMNAQIAANVIRAVTRASSARRARQSRVTTVPSARLTNRTHRRPSVSTTNRSASAVGKAARL